MPIYPKIKDIEEMLEVTDRIAVKYLYKKDADDAAKFFRQSGYQCQVQPRELTNKNRTYILIIKKQLL